MINLKGLLQEEAIDFAEAFGWVHLFFINIVNSLQVAKFWRTMNLILD